MPLGAKESPPVRQLTDAEVREFYAAYRAMEVTARGYHQAAIRYASQRDFLVAAVVTVFLLIFLL
jgi:hypothetical protein